MARTAFTRPLPAFAAAVLMTVAGAGFMPHAALAATAIMPDGSIRYDYGRRPMPVLACKPQYVCDIVLDSGETVLNMAIGDASRWVIAGGKSGAGGTTPHVFVKPLQPDLDTNLVVTTTKHVYNVALHSANNARPGQISFFYADEDAAAKAAIAEQERLAIAAVLAGNPQVDPDKLDTKYKLAGDAALLPEKVYNDGVRTFIEWKTMPADLPAVVEIAKDGSSVPVNYRVVGKKYIVDSVELNLDLVVAAINDRHGRPERRASIRHQ